MSLNLNAALSSFIAASPRLIHHSKTQHWKKKKKLFHWPVSRPKHYLCVNPQYSNSCSSSAGRLVYGPTNTWMGHKCFYLFIYFYFAQRHRPLSLPQPPPHQCCAGAGSEHKRLLSKTIKKSNHNFGMLVLISIIIWITLHLWVGCCVHVFTSVELRLCWRCVMSGVLAETLQRSALCWWGWWWEQGVRGDTDAEREHWSEIRQRHV